MSSRPVLLVLRIRAFASHQCRWQKWQRWTSTMHASRIHRGPTLAWRLYKVLLCFIHVKKHELEMRFTYHKYRMWRKQANNTNFRTIWEIRKQDNIKKWSRFNHSKDRWNPDKVWSHCQVTGLVLYSLNFALGFFHFPGPGGIILELYIIGRWDWFWLLPITPKELQRARSVGSSGDSVSFHVIPESTSTM